MDKIIKLLFIIVPPSLIFLGVILVAQAAEFWLQIVSGPKVESFPLVMVGTNILTAEAYLPMAIRPENSPIPVEVDITTLWDQEDPLFAEVIVEDGCEYIKVNNPNATLGFSNKLPKTQTHTAFLEVRKVAPPVSCSITVKVKIIGIDGNLTQRIAVDSYTGHLLSLGKVVFGFLTGLIGLRGLRGLFS